MDKKKHQDYDAFVEKFKPKRTTDDCMTPAHVYEAVKQWAVERYRLEGHEIIRPFWPGGDYENHPYPEGCVVIDNPPFSFLARIIDHYLGRGIPFLLFAPHLTLFNYSNRERLSLLVTCSDVTYANGANVKTSFVTNLEPRPVVMACGTLNAAVSHAMREAGRLDRKALPVYDYPPQVVTVSRLAAIAEGGRDFAIPRGCLHRLGRLEAQRQAKKSIFGSGFLCGENTAERMKAERMKAERMKAWTLDADELAICQRLDGMEE